MRYLLDTHAVIWLISSQEQKLPRDIRESIRYCEDSYFVSELSLVEIIQLQQGGKIEWNYPPSTIKKVIEQNNLLLLRTEFDILETFYHLGIPTINGVKHSDPFDRIIIATAIKRRLTLVSADRKFPWYEENCQLQLRSI